MSNRLKPYLKILPLLLLVLSVCGCAAVPVSDEELAKLGKEVSKNMIDQYGEWRDGKLDSYVAGVGARVEAGSDYKGEPIRFVVLDTPVVNAFSVPGGHIFITRGLLARVNSESELAFVLGHETGHLTARHVAQRISEIRTSNIFSSFLGTFVGVYSKDYQLGNLVANVVDFSSILMILNYGRAAELQADRLGLKYAYDSNYNPLTAEKFLNTLELIEKSKNEKSSAGDLFATHPPTEDRIKAITLEASELVAASPGRVKSMDVRRDAYLDHVDGLVLGESIDSGTIKDGVYYNKKYMFVLKKPNGWDIQQARSYLVAVYQDQSNAFLAYSSIPGSAESLEEYATSFLKEVITDKDFKPQFKPSSFLGLAALEFSRAKNRNIRALFFNRRETYYTLLYSYDPAIFANYNSNFVSLTSKFSFMTTDEAKGISEDKIRVYTVVKGDTAAGVSLKFYGDPKYKIKLMEYNEIAGEIKPGDLLKVPDKKYLD